MSIAPDLPPEFQVRIRNLLGDDAPAFFTSQKIPAAAGLRVNTLKLSPEQFVRLAPFDIHPLRGVPGVFLLSGEAQPGRHPYHAAGLYYLQDSSAVLAAMFLAPKPGEKVLDLSAAPGGKATHLSNLMEDQGLLVANEIDSQRVWDLAENLERWGTHSTVITNESPERLAEHFPGYFDRVLLDAPCSGEGMFWKSQSARQQWSPALVQSCAIRQASIISQAAKLLKPGGRLAYATCTFAPEENEGVLAEFLAAHPAFDLLEPPHLEGLAPGLSEWGGSHFHHLEKAVRAWPHRWPGGGQFIALVEKQGETSRHHEGGVKHPSPRNKTGRMLAQPSKEAVRLLASFWEQTLTLPSPAGELAQMGDQLYRLPPSLPDFSGLRVLRPGLWLGTIKKNRFEPSHALALALTAEIAQRRLNLSPADPNVFAYLRGETLAHTGAQGWVLVTVDHFPLGWGKQVGDTLKNHYPRGLRRP